MCYYAGAGGQGIQAHGVGAGQGAEHEIFLSANFTLVETHKGSDTRLNCRVKRGSDYGTVRRSIVQNSTMQYSAVQYNAVQ